MNTDNTTIDISNESLEGAALLNYYADKTDSPLYSKHYISGAQFGANWQKEKDKAINDKLVEALKEVLNAANENNYIQFFTFGELGTKIKSILDNL